jgi:hypothetical protein
MKFIRTCFLSLLFLHATVATLPAGVTEIQWTDLIPPEYTDNDPLVGLNEEQRAFVEWIIYLRSTLPEEPVEKYAELYEEMNTALPKLKKGGLDVDEIIERRKQRDGAVNTSLDGTEVKLAGYLLPLDLEGTQVSEFLLVPYFGACIHTPPPPPNQIVHATLEKPVESDPDRMFQPVWVSGTMLTASASKDLYLVDGASSIDISYRMEAERIEPYVPPKTN